MTRGRWVALSAALLAVIALAALWLGPFRREPTLTLVLRCRAVEGGTLSAAIPGNPAESFDLQTACGAGMVRLRHYRSQHPVRLRLHTAAGDSELMAMPGDHIQAEKYGYFTVIEVTGAPPLLRNDNL